MNQGFQKVETRGIHPQIRFPKPGDRAGLNRIIGRQKLQIIDEAEQCATGLGVQIDVVQLGHNDPRHVCHSSRDGGEI